VLQDNKENEKEGIKEWKDYVNLQRKRLSLVYTYETILKYEKFYLLNQILALPEYFCVSYVNGKLCQ
jgi:hypothetical protein